MDTLPGKFFQRELGINNRLSTFTYKPHLSTLRSTTRICLMDRMMELDEWEGQRPAVNPVYSMDFNPTAPSILAVADEIGAITLIDTKERPNLTGVITYERVIQNAINRVTWSPQQAEILATASCSQTVDIWDISEFRRISSYTGHTKTVKSVKFHPYMKNIIASAGRDGSIMIWDIREPSSSIPINHIVNAHSFVLKIPKQLKKLNEVCLPVTDLVLREGHTLISCGATDGMIKFWDLRRTYKYMRRAEPVQAFTYPPLEAESSSAEAAKSHYGVGYSGMKLDSSNNLYVSTSTRDILKYNLSTNSPQPAARYLRSEIHSSEYGMNIDVSHDGRYLISGSATPFASIWDTWDTSMKPCFRLEGTEESGSICCAVFSLFDPLTLVTGGDDSMVTVWRANALEKYRDANPEDNVTFEPTCITTDSDEVNGMMKNEQPPPYTTRFFQKYLLPQYHKPKIDPFNLTHLLQDLPNFVINGPQPHLTVKHVKSRERPALISWFHSSNISEKRALKPSETEPPSKRLKVNQETATTPEPKPRRASTSRSGSTPKSRSGRKNSSTTPSSSSAPSPNSPSILKYFAPVINASPSVDIIQQARL